MFPSLLRRLPKLPKISLLFALSLPVLVSSLLSSCTPKLANKTPLPPYQTARISYTNPNGFTHSPNSPNSPLGNQLNQVRPESLPPISARPTKGPSIHGSSAIVLDARTGRILYEKNADQRRAVASTQKLLTALLVYERGGFSKSFPITYSDTKVEPTKVGIRSGERYSRRGLTHALLVRSGNDVARALARDHSGSVSAFSASMNRRARQIGMKNSNFVNPHGLTEAGQYSTARDIGTLALRIWHTPTLRKMCNDRSMTLRSSAGRAIPLKTTNKLARRWSGCTGMKTGYTRAAGRCLVSSARVNGRDIIAVILGTTSSHIWDDSEKLLRFGAQKVGR